MVGVARIILPFSMLRLSAGRDSLSEETQALCFFVGANSIHYGEKLLTTTNVAPDQDLALLEKLGLTPVLIDTELNAVIKPRICFNTTEKGRTLSSTIRFTGCFWNISSL